MYIGKNHWRNAGPLRYSGRSNADLPELVH